MPANPRASPSLHHGGAALWTTRLDRRSPVSLSRQLAAALHRAISDGGIPAGARLPSTRALALELGRPRTAIAEYLAAARGVHCRPEQVVLTAGTQQGLSLAVRILVDPGATAWVEDPCYRAAFDILRAAEARIVPVAVDDQGLDIEAA